MECVPHVVIRKWTYMSLFIFLHTANCSDLFLLTNLLDDRELFDISLKINSIGNTVKKFCYSYLKL